MEYPGGIELVVMERNPTGEDHFVPDLLDTLLFITHVIPSVASLFNQNLSCSWRLPIVTRVLA